MGFAGRPEELEQGAATHGKGTKAAAEGHHKAVCSNDDSGAASTAREEEQQPPLPRKPPPGWGPWQLQEIDGKLKKKTAENFINSLSPVGRGRSTEA